MAVNRHYSNTAIETSLVSGINNSVTSIVVGSVSGFPVSYPYTLVLDEGEATEELVEVTSAAGTTLTVVRGVDNTSASTHSAGAAVKHGVSARDFREPQEHMDDATIHIPDHSVLPPAGAIMPYAGAAAPTGWLLADGSEVSRSTYSDLFDVCGTTYGAGDGSTTFNLPDLQGKIPVGLDSAQTEFDARGETGGEKTHLLTTAELPSHSHTINHGHSASSGTESADHSHSGTTSGVGDHTHGMGLGDSATIAAGTSTRTHLGSKVTGGGGAHSHSFSTGGRSAAHTHGITVNDFSGSSGSSGSGSAHNNLQPYIVLNYIIKT